MKLLLDENIDKRLKSYFDDDFVVFTVPEKGWQGTKNGALLKLAASEFDVFITMDKNLEHQQNLDGLDIAVVVIRAYSSALSIVSTLMPKVNEAVRDAPIGAVTQITP
jgi:predicted nuclease of predicted toxin-antitoxin system